METATQAFALAAVTWYDPDWTKAV